MAGVSGPMWRRSPQDALRFFAGLFAGELLGSVAVATVVLLVGNGVEIALPQAVRWELTIMLFAAVSFADLFGRTPQWRRQVPERFFTVLPAGSLGLVWGSDLGLLVTTRKTSSASWMMLGGLVCLNPTAAFIALPVGALTSCAIVVVRALLASRKPIDLRRRHNTLQVLRSTTGAVGLLVAAVMSYGLVAGWL